MIHLGPFELRTSLAKGAVGQVWRATHRASGVDVAVKVIRESRAREERYRSALRHEIRAMARLDHPGIVGIVDHGEVDAQAERDSDGQLAEGSPWLAMALVPGGAIHPLAGRLTWVQVRRVLRGLLPALGHAHARGVLHRDVKPANVLLASESTLRVMLTDFGVAHPIARGAPAGPSVAGTPGFMAPEQREGRWRDFGPWTDLFGLGRTAEFLLRGKEGKTPDVPAGYPEWIGHMLAEHPAHRFRVAADALAELEALGPAVAPLGEAPTSSGAGTTYFDLDAPPPEEPDSGGGATVAPTVATGWRPEAWADSRIGLNEAVLRLAVLRVAPLVGRSDERKWLWSELGAVRQGPRAVVVRGGRGVGKTRLVRWLAESAFETGVGGPVFAVHSEQAGAGDGVGGSLARLLGYSGLGRSEIAGRSREVVALWGIDAPEAEPVLTAVFGGGPALRPDERVVGLSRVLGWLAHRPVVLVLDDLERGRESAEVAARLLAGSAPVLVVGTCVAEPGWLDGLFPDRTTRDLGPPDAPTHRAMVRGLIPLDSDLTGRITEHTLGDPRRAVAMVRELAARDQLRAGVDGFSLAPGVNLGSVSAAEDARVVRFGEGRPEDDGIALELCAVTGAVVETTEHAALLAAWGASPSEGWLDDAADHGLVRLEVDGCWQLADGLREALRARMAAGGRLERAHAVRAEVLLAGGGERGVVGRHLSEAGKLERALELLEQGVRDDLQRGAFHQARQWVREWQRVAVRAGIPQEDPRNGELALLDLLVDLARDRFDGLNRGLDSLSARAAAEGWPRVAAEVAWLRGRTAYHRGRSAEAIRWLERGLAAAQELDDPLLRARCTADLGRTESRKGNLFAALDYLEQSWEDYASLEHHSGLNLVSGELADVHRALGHFDEATAWAARCAEEAVAIGGATNLSDAALIQGETARAAGRLAEAEEHYRRAIYVHMSSVNFQHAASAQLNLALVGAMRQDWSGALALAERCIDTFSEDAREWMQAAAHVVALAPAAALGDREALGKYLVRAEALLVRTGFVAPDIRLALGLAIEQVRQQGWTGEAERLEQMLADQGSAEG